MIVSKIEAVNYWLISKQIFRNKKVKIPITGKKRSADLLAYAIKKDDDRK